MRTGRTLGNERNRDRAVGGAWRETRAVTPAIVALERAGVSFTLHEYDAGDHDFGLDAATKLGLDPDQVFKTLVVVSAERPAVAIVPVSATLALKAVGKALGAKRADMCDPAVAERVTGYVRGGISPFGQRQRLPTVIDRSAPTFDTIYVSGGKRGVDLGIAPDDLIRLLDATVAAIAAI